MISGLCSVCGKATKHPHSCTFCGAVVCEEHYDVSMGMCSRCKSRLRRTQVKPESSGTSSVSE